MVAPIYPNGPWSMVGGVPTYDFNPDYTNPNYQRPTYFTFGPIPYQATVAHSASGTTSLPFTSLIFDETPNVWADSALSAGQLSASVRANNCLYWA